MTKLDFALDAKYRQEEGRIFLSGIQALVRLPLDQHRADKRRGLNTATLISGYRGSPLGGFDLTLERNPALLAEHQVKFISGVNEDLGATAIYGSQLANFFPKPKYDGVLGVWYGKGPGVDRTGDIFKHANFAGIGKYGGVLALGGDDPLSKSSTLPTHSEVAFFDAMFPVLFPGNVQEILDLGRFGFELSRYAGLWVAFKIVTNVADEIGTAEVSPDRLSIVDPGFTLDGRPWRHTQNPTLLPPFGLEMERDIHNGRLEAAKAFAAANKLNRITVPTPDAWLGIAAAGKTYYDLRQALTELGLGDDAALRRYGIRLLKIGMLFPMESGIVREFARGLEEILVIEEKRSFVELFIRDALYNAAARPPVVGKRDLEGRPLVPAHGELDSDRIAQILAVRLERKVRLDSITARVALLEALRERPAPLTLARPAYFCSGCPHNTSTHVPEGSMAAAGIGCHGMALLMPERRTTGVTHMGGEGAQWVGMAPFTTIDHMFQNLGDGTMFHSGSLAIRQAVAAGTHMTYKILYNSAVAMTGGQDAAGAMPVPELTRELEAEGVKKVLVVTDDPEKYPRDTRWGEGVEVWHRDRLDEAQQLLRAIPGVTALVYDQRCAAEKRRLRKRGKLEDPKLRVFINEAVCEGCGDCGVKSNCLSVHPVDTEFGRKTQIHQSSCNKDYSCLKGDCPSFLTVIPLGEGQKARKPFTVDRELPEPALRVPREANVFMMGIGGTGVVTVNQILGTAAVLDGRHVRGLDQTGLSQKGGPVVSHLKIFETASDVSNKISAGEADCYIGFDLLVATSQVNLDHARPDKTIAVISTSQVPTGSMVSSPDVHFPDQGGLTASINRVTRKDENVYVDAIGLGESLFGDHMAANMIMLGAAFQAGAVPVSAAALEEAIALNGVSVQMNTQAFRVGRLAVANPEWLASVRPRRVGAVEVAPALGAEARALVDAVGAAGEVKRLLEIRVPELIAYQDAAYARSYTEFVKRVADAERLRMPGETRFSEGVARHLFKLMAYKDEYEVARLHLRADVAGALAEEFPGGVRLAYNLHPPMLRALGWNKKIRFGGWFDGVFRALVSLRRLRGTALDPFGRAAVRRVERQLPGEYRALVEKTFGDLGPATYDRAVKLANLPDVIRGYEDIKLRNVEKFRAEVRSLGI